MKLTMISEYWWSNDNDWDGEELCVILADAHFYSGAPPWGGVLCDGDPPHHQ